jgi:circadian clock protein KaiC
METRVSTSPCQKPREELIAGAESHGWSLDGLEIVELIADAKELDADTQVTMYHPSEVELSETTKRVLEAVERVKPSRIVFDSLSEMRLLAQNPLRYRRQILALKQFFIGKQCTVLLVDDRTSDKSDLQLRSIAHCVISLEQFAPLYGPARRRLRVIKFRGSDFRGGYHDCYIKRGGLAVFPRLVASEHAETFEQGCIKSGVMALDALLGGGPEQGTSTLLLGPAGSGKSTIDSWLLSWLSGLPLVGPQEPAGPAGGEAASSSSLAAGTEQADLTTQGEMNSVSVEL